MSLALKVDFQGHRGCRGLMPENTIEGFLYAMDLGVTTLEMDVVITKDLEVLVSHEPYMSEDLCIKPDLTPIINGEQLSYNIFNMNYSEVKKWDCGLRFNPRFPDQKKIKAGKPLLVEVIKETQKHLKKNQKIYYNIEIKSTKEWEFKYHPSVQQYCDLVLKVIKQSAVLDYVTIQSFDNRVLIYLNSNFKREIKLSYLFEKGSNIENEVMELNFFPDIISPDFEMVNETLMHFSKRKTIEVIPWTVNDVETMKRLITLGVGGIISDYPTLFKMV